VSSEQTGTWHLGSRIRDSPNWLYDFHQNHNLDLLLMEFSGGIEDLFCIDGGLETVPERSLSLLITKDQTYHVDGKLKLPKL
jgi:hypothetical protein